MDTSGTETTMAEYVNQWESYKELSIENDRDPVLDDPVIYGVNVKHFTLTVYSPDGRVKKYWNAPVSYTHLTLPTKRIV